MSSRIELSICSWSGSGASRSSSRRSSRPPTGPFRRVITGTVYRTSERLTFPSKDAKEVVMRSRITIVGGGIAGLSAAISCAEAEADVTLLEARCELGGRARSNDGPYKANLGPHVVYKDGAF